MSAGRWHAGALALAVAALPTCGSASGPDTRLAGCAIEDSRIGEFVTVPAGQFLKGHDAIYPEEQPEIKLHVDAFSILAHEVTNDQFAAFVEETGYITDAERSVREARPGAGSAVFQDGRWHLVSGASWKTPDEKGSNIDGKGSWPVVHVSLADAQAYAAWAGGRLPSEEEWEYAARAGLPDQARDTSGAYEDDGSARANTWQGVFPVANLASDGFEGAAPVGCFPEDRLGLHDMMGNVWEWTDTPFSEGHGTIKGGSFLCAENFCRRYRPAARQPQEIDFSSNHIGFRIVKDVNDD